MAKFIGHNLRGTYGGHFHGVTHYPRGAIALKTCACVARVRGNHRPAPPEKGYYMVDGDADGRLATTFVVFDPKEL